MSSQKQFPSHDGFQHGFTVYANLTRNFVPTARNQLWVADITYIRLAEEFVYLAVVLDANSRLVIGWALEAKLAMGALLMALKKRGAADGLIHHSDRGVQYACGDYTQLLKDQAWRISMSRKGNPCDNAKAESFMKTLKHEEANRVEYRAQAEARRDIRHFLDRTYNRKRLHSSLGYRAAVRVRCLGTKQKGSGVSFLGTAKICQSDIEKPGFWTPPVMVAQSPRSFGQPGGCFPTILVLTSLRVEIPKQVALQQVLLLSLQLQAILLKLKRAVQCSFCCSAN